jgi:hypothetical protein
MRVYVTKTLRSVLLASLSLVFASHCVQVQLSPSASRLGPEPVLKSKKPSLEPPWRKLQEEKNRWTWQNQETGSMIYTTSHCPANLQLWPDLIQKMGYRPLHLSEDSPAALGSTTNQESRYPSRQSSQSPLHVPENCPRPTLYSQDKKIILLIQQEDLGCSIAHILVSSQEHWSSEVSSFCRWMKGLEWKW